MFCPKKCDGESKNGKPVEFGENILLEGKNWGEVVKFTIESLSIRRSRYGYILLDFNFRVVLKVLGFFVILDFPCENENNN